jgi:hypothetical protein
LYLENIDKMYQSLGEAALVGLLVLLITALILQFIPSWPISVFVAGFMIQLIFDKAGINKWYCNQL